MADRRVWMVAVAGAAILGLSAGLFAWSSLRGDAELFAECRQGNVAGGMGTVGGPFELVSETGETVTDEDVVTGPTLIYFGYTFCPDVCPLDAARNAEAVDLLAERGIETKPVFVSVDPERDTPEVLAEFTDAMHPDMLGLTGSKEQVDAAADAYRVYYSVPDTEDEFYLVNHTAFTYLVLPEHGAVDFYRREATAEEIADRVACYAEAA